MPQSSQRYMVVSADGHAGADVLGYRPYLERHWLDEFDAWAATFHDKWIELDPRSESVRTEDSLKIGLMSRALSANWDSDRRVRDLDADGVAGEVLFPNTAPPFFPSGVHAPGTPRTRHEYERRWAGLKAHNRWMVDFCKELPGRRVGIAQILLNDADDAVAEIEWARNAGLTGGVLIPLLEHGAPVPPLFTEDHDRIWAACVDLDVVVNQHSGGAGLYDEYAMTPAGMAVFMLEAAENAQRMLGHVIFGGVFERFPDVKFVMTEQGTGWLVDRLNLMDGYAMVGRDEHHFMYPLLGPATSALSLRPSEYFHRNVWIGASAMRRPDVDAGVIDVAGDRLMWGNDYPHSEGTFPHSTEFLSGIFFDQPFDQTQRILGETATELYGFDRDALRAAADRIGPTVERVTSGVAS